MARSLSLAWRETVLSAVFSLVCLICGGVFTVCVADDLPGPPALTAEMDGLTIRLKTLFKQWKALPSAESTKSDQIKKEVDQALSSYLAKRLNTAPIPSASELQGELDGALRSAIWDSVFGLSPEAVSTTTNSSLPRFTLVLRGAGPTSNLYVAGFAVGYGNVFSVFLHGFAVFQGRYSPISTAGSELNSSIPEAVRLRPFAVHELRVLAWGLHIGSPEGLTSIVLYSFDGQQLRVLWNLPAVPHGKVSVINDQVVVESEKIVSQKEGLWEHERRDFRQVPEGLKPINIRRWTSR